MKAAPPCNKRNPTNANDQKLKKIELIDTYQKEQIEYIHDQMNKVRNSIEDRLSRIAWNTVKEGRDPLELNLRLIAKKNEEYTYGKNITRTCLETSLKLQINLSRKLLITNETSTYDSLLKNSKKLPVSLKYSQKYEDQKIR